MSDKRVFVGLTIEGVVKAKENLEQEFLYLKQRFEELERGARNDRQLIEKLQSENKLHVHYAGIISRIVGGRY